MDVSLEFTLDFTSKDRAWLLRVANKAIKATEKELPAFNIKEQQMLLPSDAAVVVWKMVVDAGQVDMIRKHLPFWFHYYAAMDGYLPEKAKAVLLEEMVARGISPDTLPKPAKLFG